MLRLKVIACDVLNREISFLASQSKHFVDVTFLHQGLHDTPDILKRNLQEEIDKANSGFPYNYLNTYPDYDYILLAYGLCSNGITGITSRNIPMIIPRAHDCITLLLGSKERYTELFAKHPGTYWFSGGWIERAWQPSELKYEALLKDYTERYGEENAEYLIQMEQDWIKNYSSAALISWDCLNNNEFYRSFTQSSADYFHWNYFELSGSCSLLGNMLNGVFNPEEVLVLPAGEEVKPSYDHNIITF